MKKLMIAGGGTGGHVLAGVAVAEAWTGKWKGDASVLFVGAQGGLEEKLVPRAGFPLKTLSLGSLNRVSFSKKVKTAFQIPLALLKAVWILLKWRPEFVLGVGGYASGPIVLMARVLTFVGILRARVAILEQNSVPGFTNRILGKFAHVVFAAFPGTEIHFKNKPVILTGNPIRSALKPLASAARDPFTIFIFGGSQGALGVNSLVLDSLPFLNDIKNNLRFIHQTGEKDYKRVLKGHENAGTHARVEKFIHDMPAAYAEASLLICRAGSSTLSEVAAVGRAALLVPLPTAADNHQEKNARIFTDAGAAGLFLQNKTKGEDLAEFIRKLISEPNQITQMEQKVRKFFKPDAAESLINGLTEVEEAKLWKSGDLSPPLQ